MTPNKTTAPTEGQRLDELRRSVNAALEAMAGAPALTTRKRGRSVLADGTLVEFK